MTILKKAALIGTGIALTAAMSASANAQDSWIFVFDNSVSGAEAPGLANQAVNRAGGTLGHTYSHALSGFSATMSAKAAERLAANNPRIAYYHADGLVSISAPPPGKGPGGGGDGGTDPETVPWGIARVKGGVDGTGKTACVLDTGIDLDHPDLNVSSTGFSAFTKGKDAGMDDGNGHGTHVAGTIGAVDNDEGVIGVAAGATVVPVKVLDSRGSGSWSGVMAGVDWVAANSGLCDVANMSLGGGFNQGLNDAVEGAAASGVVFVIAAGNESQDTNNVSPGSAGGNTLTVASMAEGDVWSSFSNWNQPPVDWIAPGSAINSTWKGGGYRSISGTSMAAPHVAGVVLLGGCSNGGTVQGPDGTYTVCSN